MVQFTRCCFYSNLQFFAPVLHGSDDFTKVDSDGDGRVTFEELIAAMPGVTEDKFKAADTNGDGALSSEEYAAAMK